MVPYCLLQGIASTFNRELLAEYLSIIILSAFMEGRHSSPKATNMLHQLVFLNLPYMDIIIIISAA